jgi:tetratricopeptide (TPR) repeat protein
MTTRTGGRAGGWLAIFLKHAIVSALAWWALWVQMMYRVPSRLLFALFPWAGVAVTALSLALLANHVLDRIVADGPVRQALRRLEWSASMVVRVFIYYSLLLFANAKLDASRVTDRPSEVTAISAVRPVLGGLAPYGWISLRPAEKTGAPIRLVLRPDERDRFWVGEAVVVEERRGRLRIPWVAGIVPDRERRNRAILEVAPDAALAWKDLVLYYIERSRFEEAAAAALRYFAIYPADWVFAVQVTDHFDVANRPAEGARVLKPLVRESPRAAIAKAYGLALARSGRPEDGVRWLEEAARLDPADFWAYHHLGNTLRNLGHVPQAIAAYERALALKPGFPEVEVELELLRKAVLRKPA